MIRKVTTYYLEMGNATEFKPSKGYLEKLEIRKISRDVIQYWMMFIGVGLPWRWYSRLQWSETEWKNYLLLNDTHTFLAFSDNKLVGYFELLFQNDKAVEIKFFGLFPDYIGAGYGGHLLSHAVDIAWKSGASKVWLHTCTTDHESALTNYLSRGFEIVSKSEEEENIPSKEEYLKMVNEFLSGYYDSHVSF